MTQPTVESVVESIRSFIIENYLPGEDPRNLTADLDLQENGIVDSVQTMDLVSHVESTYSIEISPNEVSNDFSCLREIAELVIAKLG